MIARIPRNRISLSILGGIFFAMGLGALVQDKSVLKFCALAGVGALMFWMASREKPKPSSTL